MRYFEIASGLRLPINEEEQALLDKAYGCERLPRSELDEREEEVARLMVTRGLLKRRKDDNGTFYEPNDMNDLWRN